MFNYAADSCVHVEREMHSVEFFESADGIVTSRIPLPNLGVHGCLAALLEQERHTIYLSISPGYVAEYSR